MVSDKYLRKKTRESRNDRMHRKTLVAPIRYRIAAKGLTLKAFNESIHEYLGFGSTISAKEHLRRLFSRGFYVTPSGKLLRQLERLSRLMYVLDFDENSPVVEAYKREYPELKFPPSEKAEHLLLDGSFEQAKENLENKVKESES